MPQPTSSPLTRWRLVLWRGRHVAAAMLAGLAVLVGWNGWQPRTGIEVAVASRDLRPGEVIASGDVRLVTAPPEALPATALSAIEPAVGQRVAHPVPEGSALTPSAWVGPGLTDGLAAGTVAVPLQLPDPRVAALVEPGARVSLVGMSAYAEAARVLASDVLVLARLESSSSSSLLGDQTGDTPLLVFALPQDVATLVLDASNGGFVTVLLDPEP